MYDAVLREKLGKLLEAEYDLLKTDDEGRWVTPLPPVEYLPMYTLMTDEDMIDAGIATPDQIARYEQRRRESEARWRALPWRVRFMRRQVRPRWYELTHRLSHAIHALRGIDCERD